METYRFRDFAHKKALFKGEACSGKTLIMRRLVQEAAESLPLGSVSLIDMAPDRRVFGGKKIGGAIHVGDFSSRINYMRPERIHAPRLEGKSCEKVLQLARENAERIEVFLGRYLDAPTSVLFVNDLTIYLHTGSLKKMQRAVEMADTFIGNAYEGLILAEDYGSGISETERRLLNRLEGSMDMVLSI